LKGTNEAHHSEPTGTDLKRRFHRLNQLARSITAKGLANHTPNTFVLTNIGKEGWQRSLGLFPPLLFGSKLTLAESCERNILDNSI
jgi:hypothetical protein